ncbi:hypothetical protein [Streptomyces clavifer]
MKAQQVGLDHPVSVAALPFLYSLATGMERDRAAADAALTLLN